MENKKMQENMNDPSEGWDHLIQEICLAIGQLTGNVLSVKQRPMVQSRLRRRMIDLRITSPAEYRAYWQSHLESENKYLISLLTTHFTSFFREFSHFEWIESELPALVKAAKEEKRNVLNFWSA